MKRLSDEATKRRINNRRKKSNSLHCSFGFFLSCSVTITCFLFHKSHEYSAFLGTLDDVGLQPHAKVKNDVQTQRSNSLSYIRNSSGEDESTKSIFLSSMNLTEASLYKRNYFYRVWMDLSTDAQQKQKQKHLPPMEVLTRYISEHSHQQLEREWKEACGNSSNSTNCALDATKSSRKFVVATYSCPFESGNRLHRFMNGLMWATLTNRTLLWRYKNYDVCEEYGEENCEKAYEFESKGPSDCDGMLIRSPWIPSYDEWKDKLGLASDHSDIVRAEAFKKPYDNTTLPFDGVNPDTGINNDEIRVIRIGNQIRIDPKGILHCNEKELSEQRFLQKPQNLANLHSLRSQNVYFVFGMFFSSLFTIDPVLEPPRELVNDKASQTIFLHSRHTGMFPNTYTWPEQLCLQWIASTLRFNNTNGIDHIPCHIYLMSDRPIATAKLTEIIANVTHCTSTTIGQDSLPTAEQKFVSPSFSNEHGPRAGLEFWRDLALSIHARDGMIAFQPYRGSLCRTSTALVRELVEFHRTLEHHYKEIFEVEIKRRSKNVMDGELSEFKQCMNPWKEGKDKKKRK